MDVIKRLESVIIEVERENESVCIVGHQAILRCVYAYFMQVPREVVRPPPPSFACYFLLPLRPPRRIIAPVCHVFHAACCAHCEASALAEACAVGLHERLQVQMMHDRD
jgi:broad specificity phosphatase PhoE